MDTQTPGVCSHMKSANGSFFAPADGQMLTNIHCVERVLLDP